MGKKLLISSLLIPAGGSQGFEMGGCIRIMIGYSYLWMGSCLLLTHLKNISQLKQNEILKRTLKAPFM